MITIARYSLPLEAQIARASLEAAGIPAFIADEHTINMNWLYSDALGGVRLQVPEAHAEEALALLAADHSAEVVEEVAPVPEEPVRCRRCGGENLQPIRPGRRIAFLLWLLISIPLWPVRARRECQDCGARQR